MTPDASTAQPTPAQPTRLLQFRSGGIYLVLAAVLALLTAGHWAWRWSQGPPRIGDGRSLDSYGYDLSVLLVPRDELVPAGFCKDGIPSVTRPTIFTLEEADAFAGELRSAHQGKFLVASELVIGVEINGEARAYPLRIITWHEIVNDILGGEPIAVTYNPLCNSSVVFDRRVNGEVLEFGVSGLVYKSNLVMFDRRPGGVGESLWSQLQCRALAGPAAASGAHLRRVPCVVAPWSVWLAAHPNTTLLGMDREKTKLYRRSYQAYFGNEELRFEVSPLPPGDGIPFKTPVVAVPVGTAWYAFTIAAIAELADSSGVWRTTAGSETITFHYVSPEPSVVVLDESGRPRDAVYSFWFAWYAHHPDSALVAQERAGVQ